MDQAPLRTTSAPVTEDALLADRQAFWSWFTSATTIAIVVVAAILVGLAVFLL